MVSKMDEKTIEKYLMIMAEKQLTVENLRMFISEIAYTRPYREHPLWSQVAKAMKWAPIPANQQW